MEHDPTDPQPSAADLMSDDMSDERTWLTRYVIGDLNAGRRASVEQWLAAHPARVDALRQMQAVWQTPPADTNDTRNDTRIDSDAALASVMARIDTAAAERAAQLGQRSSRAVGAGRIAMSNTRASRWVTAGVMAVVVCALALFGGRATWRHLSRQSTTASTVAYATYTTGNGQIAHLTLHDGTRVTLAPNTILGVSRDFQFRRDVSLTGEAYFDVVQSHATPFLVHTGAVTTHVLGTTFDVTRYHGDRAVRVVVLSGRVTVGGRQAVTLSAGGIGHVTDSTATAATMTDATPFAAWTTGALVFHGAAVSDMLDALGHWYGLQFRLADSSLAGKVVAATFASGETRADALELVGTLLNVTMTFDDGHDGTTIVTLHPKSGLRRASPAPRRSNQDSLFPRATEVGR